MSPSRSDVTLAPLVLVSGWSDNGWLSGGHAVRMAVELCMFDSPDNPCGLVQFLISFWSLTIRHCNADDIDMTAMHQAWPRLMKRIEAGKASDSSEDKKLITASRTWFCLYLFEHQ